MLFRDVVTLIGTTKTTVDDYGDVTETTEETTVFADKQSIRQSEFYQAAATGLRPELMFSIRSMDYNNEKKLKYNNKEYIVIRAYDKDGEFTELVCQGVVNNANA